MVGVKGRSGRAQSPEHLAQKQAAAVKGGLAAKAARDARRQAFFADAATDDLGDEHAPVPTAPAIVPGAPAVAEDGTTLPMPSADLRAYPDGEAERQLAWGRYLAGQERAIRVQTLNRERIPVDDVRDWCGRVTVIINRRHPLLLDLADRLPNATAEQREWLKAQVIKWDTESRDAMARETIT